ncbi:Mov34/MPN/PAD-1 family protein [Thermincola ferriacetica]|uniref:Mov34/MPN/PAD-1 family protein n=1 Tax=Thermincola ferriacetica TaxID=281456 RepID=A0A0L6W4U7_9FIRM|nr:M67 family metallopeptidase [Thermincola ferriacetica]KNZ70602.1 Mov34/MPN/PAD-1 family protein [Thermincola ferriacetica]
MIKIPETLVEQMIRQANEELPNECCGILAGKAAEGIIEIVEIYPMTNIDHSPEHFSLDPKEQLEVYKSVRERGLKVLGNYHSHPATPSRPSREDIRLAFDPAAVYMILSLMTNPPVLKAFHIENGDYREIPMQVI